MSVALRSTYQLVDGILDEGLPFVGSYVQKLINLTVIITDQCGQIHYPESSGDSRKIFDSFIQLPTAVAENDYYYEELESCFYYRVKCNGSNAFVVIKNLSSNQIPQIVSILSDVKLAIKCYFTKINKDKNRFERELSDFLFYGSNANLKDILKLSNMDLDPERPYYISIIEVKDSNKDVDWPLIVSYTREYFKRAKIVVLSFACANCLTILIPACIKNDVAEGESRLNYIDSDTFKKSLEKQFNIITSQGESRIHPLIEVERSFYEARMALTIPRLLGEQNYVQKFSELGVFSLILSQSIESVTRYCLNLLNPIIENDKKTKGELLPTLRILLDNSFNLKISAESLFVHVNTLYYRISKIEQMLNIDLSKMDNRVNLFTAIKVYDSLAINGFFNRKPTAITS